MEIER